MTRTGPAGPVVPRATQAGTAPGPRPGPGTKRDRTTLSKEHRP